MASKTAQVASGGPSRRHGAQRQDKRQVRGRLDARPEGNPAFAEYYKQQRVVPEEVWEDFIGSLKTPTPVVVRLNRTKPHWQNLEACFKADARWSPLPWAPCTWQCQARDYDDSLQRQIAALNKAYALRVQEAASLVPPLLLNLNEHDIVLDMCSAPGSKTLECLELMRSCGETASDSGVMVANDADAERAFELLPLITRKARHPGTIVTLVNGAKFPPVFQSGKEVDMMEQLLFDRVLCDVPCSGDGTLRKNPHFWVAWSVNLGLSFHTKQLRLLCRGLHLLKEGGLLAYSTCSLNPIENEAVVAAALERFKGDVCLVSSSIEALSELGLQHSSGLKDWGVPDPSNNASQAPDENTNSLNQNCVRLLRCWADVPEGLRHPKGAICETMFPPQGSGREDILEALRDSCIRLNPHAIDGSGFFVAIFRKTKHCTRVVDPAMAMTPAPHLASTTDSSAIGWRARNDVNHYEVVDMSSEAIKDIISFYGLGSVPGKLVAEFNIKGRLTQLNLINEALLRFLQGRLQSKASPLLISVGVPLFKQLPDGFMTEIQLSCRWRPALEGASLLAPLMGKRVLRLDLQLLKQFLACRLLPMQELLAYAASGEITGISTCGGLLGAAVVGSKDGTFWSPCMVTGQGLELFANAEELGSPVPDLLPPKDYGILLEGNGYVVLEKPSGLRTEDALDTLRREHPAAELVSRLDKDTSGCLLVPTNSSCAKTFTAQFASRQVHKTYLALVWGNPTGTDVIEAPLGLIEAGGGNRFRAYVDSDQGKECVTNLQTLWIGDNLALVAAMPLTGRTHQIRCHLSHIGCPLVGDWKYGQGLVPSWCSRLPLHCLRLNAHDENGSDIKIVAPLPDDFVKMLEPAALEAVEQFCSEAVREL